MIPTRKFPDQAATPWPALLIAAGLTAMLCLDRAPVSADFVVPRRAGWALFQGAMNLAHSPGGAKAGWLILAMFLGGASLMLRQFIQALQWRANSARLKAASAWIALLLGSAVLFEAVRFPIALWLNVLVNVWFAPGAADLREPILAFLGAFWIVFLGGGAWSSLACWAVDRQASNLRRLALWISVLSAGALGLYIWAAMSFDYRQTSLAAAASIPDQPRQSETFLILNTREGKPGFEVHDAEQGFSGLADLSPDSLQRIEDYLARRPLSIFWRQAERLLWEGYGRAQDVPRLRQSLWAAQRRGDALAWIVLAQHLSCAPPDRLVEGLLEGLSDESRWRIGGRAAQMLAEAYAGLGLRDKSAFWRKKSTAALGIAPGLWSEPPSAGALRPGGVRGRVSGIKPVRVLLYARKDPAEPYSLSPARLAAAGRVDGGGRFAFTGLAAGDYFLAFALPAGRLPSRKESFLVRGLRGDIRLRANRPCIELPDLEIEASEK